MNLEEHKEALEKLDGKPRDVRMLEKLMTPQGRLDYAISNVVQKNGAHRYRALFDEPYRKRANPGLERLKELDQEFMDLTDVYHKQALVYYHGPTEEIDLIIATKEDRMEVERSIIEKLKEQMGGQGPSDEKKDDWDMGLDDWMN